MKLACLCVKAYNQYSRNIVLLAGFGPNHAFLLYLSGAMRVTSKNNALDNGCIDVASSYFAGSLWLKHVSAKGERKFVSALGCRTLPLILQRKHFRFTLTSRDVFFRLFCGTPFFR